jgi:hypothetical protein
LFFAITLAAIALVYVGLTAGLESDVRAQKLDTLGDLARQYSPPDPPVARREPRPAHARRPRPRGGGRIGRARDAARASRAPGAGSPGPPDLPGVDSTARTDLADLQFDVALDAARTGRMQTGTEAGEAGRVAEAALPLWLRPPGARRSGVFYVVVFSSPVEGRRRHGRPDPPPRARRRARSRCAAALLAGILAARAFSPKAAARGARRTEGGGRRLQRALRDRAHRRAR